MNTRKYLTSKRGLALLLLVSILLLSAGCQSASTPVATSATGTPAQSTPAANATQGNGQPPAGNPPQGTPPAGGQPGGAPPGGQPGGGQPGGQPSGANGASAAPDNSNVHTTAGVYVNNGARDASKEYTDGSVSVTNAGQIGKTSASGVMLASTAYTATGLVVAGGTYTLGGSAKTYSVYTNKAKGYLGTGTTSASGSDLLGTFDSVLLFGVKDEVDTAATLGSSAIDVGSGATLKIDHTYVQVDGARRYAVSNYGSGTLIVNDSTFVTTGNAGGKTGKVSLPFSNEPLLISGSARTNFSVGASKTYYYNSTVIAEGWAALSTDSASGNGLDLYAYNTRAAALNGGYGTYADGNCRDWLYGSELTSAEVGAIIAQNGAISVADGAAASKEVLANNTGATTTAASSLTAGRNAVVIHNPDMMGQGSSAAKSGTLSVTNSKLATSKTLTSTYDYATYSAAIKAYVDYVSGDDILVKSTSATINLTGAELSSYNGVLIHSVLNNDSMGNFLKAGDNTQVKPIAITLKDMSASGDVLHEDYQRNMEITLDKATLTGAIRQGSYASWKALWAGKNVTAANWLKDGSWSGTNSLAVTLKNGATWTVSAESTLTSLTLAGDATLAAPAGKTLVLTVNGSETPLKAGTYTGTIKISIK